MNKKVAASLAQLQSQIDSINKKQSSGTRTNNDELQRGIKLRTEMLNLERNGLNAGKYERMAIQQQIEAREREYNQLDKNIKLQVQGAEKVQKAEEAYDRSLGR